jgi:hypothetical protein
VLMEWLDEPGKEHRMRNLDVPVRNFLQYGGEFAIDIVDRIIETVDAAASDPTLIDSLDSSTTGLPTVLVTELVAQLRDKPVRWRGRRSAGTVVERRPNLVYSLVDDQIVVTVPYPRISPEEPWHVSLDGQVREVYARRAWGKVGDEQPSTLMPLPAPVREVLMWHDPTDTNVAVRVVDKADPLLTFSPDGRLIPRRDGLRDEVWAVYPADCELVDPTSGTLVDVSGDAGSPAGWRGWRTTLVDLGPLGALQLRRGGVLVGTARTIRKDARPRFDFEPSLVGAATSDGRSVHAGRPWVMLPPSDADIPTSWRVRTRVLGETEWLCDAGWHSDDEEVCVDPFDEDVEPQVGLFEVVVTGPLGTDARAVFFLAEGLWLEFDTALREPISGGLAPCKATIGSEYELVVSADELVFAREELQKPVSVGVHELTAEIMVRPPHVEVRAGVVGAPAVWRTTPDVWGPDDLADDRFVAVRAPGVSAVEFVLVDSGGQRVQVEREPSRKPGGAYQIATQRFADTARRIGVGRLVAKVTTDAGSVEVATLAVRPTELSAGARIVDDVLVFDDLVTAGELSVYAWCMTAPWQPIMTLPIEGNVARLPADLIDAGDLLCRVFVDDPWTTIEPPAHLAASDLRATQPGWFRSGSDAQVKLSRFLAGEGTPPERAGAMPEIWPALTLLESDLHAGVSTSTVTSLMRLLAETPRQAFEAMGNSTIPVADKMTMLIRSELVNVSYATQDTLNELHADPWFGCMVEIADLPSLHERRADVVAERAETIDYLKEKGGDVLLNVLHTGKGVRLEEGCFDRSVFMMDGMPAPQVEDILLGLQLVPGPLLHPDSRVAGSVEAFRQRSEWMQSGWSEHFSVKLSGALSMIRRGCRQAYDLISARSEALDGVDIRQHPWMLMSLQSISLAFLARLEAHGAIEGAQLDSALITTWARLASCCPRMVATDLLIAEAVVTHAQHGDLVGQDA